MATIKEEATASASAGASAGAATDTSVVEKKATDTVSDESRRPVDPCYVGQDIDLDTLTPEQLPELRRRAGLANAMARRREEHAAQQQATLEREIAVEELRLQKLRLREEAERLEGPFQTQRARDTSRERAKRSDAEAARRVAAGTAATGTGESWVLGARGTAESSC